jgi:hypothetical protein
MSYIISPSSIWKDGNDICAHFSPEDIPDIIKAIIVQCAK